MQTPFVLVEQNLVDYRGHYYGYIKSLVDCLENRNTACRTVCHRDARPELCGAVRGIPHFSWRFNGLFPGYFRIGRHVFGMAQRAWFRRVCRHFRSDLRGLPARIRVTHDSICYFSTLISPEILGIAQWLRTVPEGERPRIAVMLRFRPGQPYIGRRLSERFYTHALRALASLDSGGRVALVSDSNLLAERYSDLADLRVGTVPIPHTAPTGGFAGIANGLTGGPPPLRMAFLGRAVPEKGFAMLPRIFEPFREDIAGERLSLTVQGPSVEEGALERAMGAVASELRDIGATVLPTALPPGEYYQALRNAHVIILPYQTRANDYLGTSGVFTEAVALGKPVIVTAGTWMAKQLEALGAGRVVPRADGPSFQIAVREVLDNPGPILARSARVAEAWRRFHNPENLIRCLESSFDTFPGGV